MCITYLAQFLAANTRLRLPGYLLCRRHRWSNEFVYFLFHSRAKFLYFLFPKLQVLLLNLRIIEQARRRFRADVAASSHGVAAAEQMVWHDRVAGWCALAEGSSVNVEQPRRLCGVCAPLDTMLTKVRVACLPFELRVLAVFRKRSPQSKPHSLSCLQRLLVHFNSLS
eukprot:SAG31_NODE_825_length_11760_cov_5.637767_11_plen_168_part_00